MCAVMISSIEKCRLKNISECAEDVFGVVVRISSQGKEDFKEECLSNNDAFTLQDWVNAFEWITISLSCKKCGLSDKEWLNLETM